MEASVVSTCLRSPLPTNKTLRASVVSLTPSSEPLDVATYEMRGEGRGEERRGRGRGEEGEGWERRGGGGRGEMREERGRGEREGRSGGGERKRGGGGDGTYNYYVCMYMWSSVLITWSPAHVLTSPSHLVRTWPHSGDMVSSEHIAPHHNIMRT